MKHIVACVIVLLAVSCNLAEARQDRYFRSKTFIGLNLPFGTIGSDFGNQNIYADILSIPFTGTATQSTSGLGIIVGNSFDDEEHISGYLNYMISSNRGTQASIRYDNTLSVVSADLRYEFRTASHVRPYIVGGFNAARIVTTHSPGTSADFTGYGLDFGTGIAFYPYRRFGITASVLYRVIRFYQTGGQAYAASAIVSSGVNFFLGVEYAFRAIIGNKYCVLNGT